VDDWDGVGGGDGCCVSPREDVNRKSPPRTPRQESKNQSPRERTALLRSTTTAIAWNPRTRRLRYSRNGSSLVASFWASSVSWKNKEERQE